MNVFKIIEQIGNTISIVDVVICLGGLLIFAYWLLKTSFGKNALANSPPRRNNMPLYLPFIPLFIWWGSVSIATSITAKLLPDLPEWKTAFLDNIILCIGAIITISIIIFLARDSFQQRLKGFGLNIKTIHKDFFFAFVNLVSIWPIVLATILITTFLGKFIWGQDFHLEQHDELKTIITYPQLPLRVLVIVVTIIVAPALEEMIFRGLFQTMIRTFFEIYLTTFIRRGGVKIQNAPWLAIVISSGLFVVVHINVGHWPALFALGMCLGYAYEKSGSLLRPIFIHSFFNGITIIAVLIQ